ncbi:hypothetical protein NUH88_08820 [Nisaea acidiphila]|uniref:DUF2946 domain-containing protein n=1 Tax=Nisaea acidiphila TaxID=1862145 RepID=A0A9J7B296_9PROT|nr:hypothetical protein [Nisaea acidiphila]UUX51789.1 hypothetical protein NUH88_08820 [Nisaea acidiphila]
MARADLTTAERGKLTGAYRRHRILAAMFGLLALLLQTGFSIGTVAGAGNAMPGGLAADLAVLCMDASKYSGGGTENGTDACDHCRLCGPALSWLPPELTPASVQIATSEARGLPEQKAALRLFTSSSYPRAPPA